MFIADKLIHRQWQQFAKDYNFKQTRLRACEWLNPLRALKFIVFQSNKKCRNSFQVLLRTRTNSSLSNFRQKSNVRFVCYYIIITVSHHSNRLSAVCYLFQFQPEKDVSLPITLAQIFDEWIWIEATLSHSSERDHSHSR